MNLLGNGVRFNNRSEAKEHRIKVESRLKMP